LIPLSLYIHFPWCVRKCPYCDFNSHTLKEDLPEEKYIQQLLKDFRAELPAIKNRCIHSIFMGGGTPSLFSPRMIKNLLENIQNEIAFESPGIEITLEANPGTVEQEKFREFRAAGVNRLSLGIQSFDPVKLKTLGRIHDDTAAFKAIESAKNAGFTNFNLDLMHGLPGQTAEEALKDIRCALQAGAPHISWYQLTLEPNTLFYQRPPVLPEEDILHAIDTSGQAVFQEYHYQHYEISAYCLEKSHCQHNLNYWKFGDYVGIGAGAHGKITHLETKKIYRSLKPKHPREYLHLETFSAISPHLVAQKSLPFEFMLNALRLQKTLPWSLFSERVFIDPQKIWPVIKKLSQKNLISYNTENFTLTPLGKKFLNDVLTEFLPV
jgi:putative oxygen-independent coproporphyrinogen III oxidase